jgi:hypothetical protein
MLSKSRIFCLSAMASVLVLVGLSDGAFASSWNANHPARAEVNRRLANQNRRINHEFREGDISRAQAHRLHREDHFLRGEERFMASQQHGHITRPEQRALNQQENGISRQIGQ